MDAFEVKRILIVRGRDRVERVKETKERERHTRRRMEVNAKKKKNTKNQSTCFNYLSMRF